jgi:hypothetical protein
MNLMLLKQGENDGLHVMRDAVGILPVWVPRCMAFPGKGRKEEIVF